MILYLSLLISTIFLAMEQPPVAVSSPDGRHTWHVSQQVLAQISTLHNQRQDMNTNQVFLSPAVDPEHFTALLPLLSCDKRQTKILLRAKSTTQLAQVARDADCLGAQTLLERSLRVLEKRVGDGHVVDLPETLKQELVGNILRRNPHIRSMLYKTSEHPHTFPQTQEVRVCGISRDAIQIDTDDVRQSVNLNGFAIIPEPEKSHIIHSSRAKKALIFNESEVLFLDPEEQRVIKKEQRVIKHWNFSSVPAVLLPYDQGFFCIARGAEQNHDFAKYIIYYRLQDNPILIIPFESCFPTAMALSNDGSKLVVGSLAGFLSIFNAQTGALVRHLAMPLPNRHGANMTCYYYIHTLAVDPKSQYIAVGKRHRLDSVSRIELWNVKKLTHRELGSFSSYIEDLCFDKTGSYLYVLEYAFISIWDTKNNKRLHKIKSITFDGPHSCKSNTLTVDDAGAACSIYGHYADKILTLSLIDKNTMQELATCSIPVIAFLARVSKKIAEGKQITRADEPEAKKLKRLLPISLQKVIYAHMPWKDWLFS